jgi:hypothetical protein
MTFKAFWNSVFPVSIEGPPHSVTSYDTQEDLTRILTGPHSVASYDTQKDAGERKKRTKTTERVKQG